VDTGAYAATSGRCWSNRAIKGHPRPSEPNISAVMCGLVGASLTPTERSATRDVSGAERPPPEQGSQSRLLANSPCRESDLSAIPGWGGPRRGS